MNMLDFTHFNAAFPTDGPSPYDPTFSRQIETFRKSFDGVLFIDRVLHRLGIKDGLFPSPSPLPKILTSLFQHQKSTLLTLPPPSAPSTTKSSPPPPASPPTPASQSSSTSSSTLTKNAAPAPPT